MESVRCKLCCCTGFQKLVACVDLQPHGEEGMERACSFQAAAASWFILRLQNHACKGGKGSHGHEPYDFHCSTVFPQLSTCTIPALCCSRFASVVVAGISGTIPSKEDLAPEMAESGSATLAKIIAAHAAQLNADQIRWLSNAIIETFPNTSFVINGAVHGSESTEMSHKCLRGIIEIYTMIALMNSSTGNVSYVARRVARMLSDRAENDAEAKGIIVHSLFIVDFFAKISRATDQRHCEKFSPSHSFVLRRRASPAGSRATQCAESWALRGHGGPSSTGRELRQVAFPEDVPDHGRVPLLRISYCRHLAGTKQSRISINAASSILSQCIEDSLVVIAKHGNLFRGKHLDVQPLTAPEYHHGDTADVGDAHDNGDETADGNNVNDEVVGMMMKIGWQKSARTLSRKHGGERNANQICCRIWRRMTLQNWSHSKCSCIFSMIAMQNRQPRLLTTLYVGFYACSGR